MTTGDSDRARAGLDDDAAAAWIARHVGGVAPPLRFALIAGGRSNLTYRVDDHAGQALVLRRPPLGNVLTTAHDMSREWRAISALGPTPVPVPPAVAYCDDETVIGAPFYLMEYVPGTVVANAETARALTEQAREATGYDLVRVLARLHAVDPDQVGLGELGRKEGYVERQLRRWHHQWEQSKTRELPVVDEVYQRLVHFLPHQQSAGIVHGDFRLGNMILDPDGHIQAVLDWELCTLGDPLADLGWLLSDWSGAGPDTSPTVPSALPGFPSRDQLLERYARDTGRDVSGIDYYVAFARWRSACIGEGVYARYESGAMGQFDVDLDALGAQVEQRAEAARQALNELPAR